MVSFWCVSFWIPCRYLYSLVSHHSVVSFAGQELLNFKKSYLLILGIVSCAVEDLLKNAVYTYILKCFSFSTLRVADLI